jgi:hypothetical protein
MSRIEELRRRLASEVIDNPTVKRKERPINISGVFKEDEEILESEPITLEGTINDTDKEEEGTTRTHFADGTVTTERPSEFGEFSSKIDDDMSFLFDEALYGENKDEAVKSIEAIGKLMDVKNKFRQNLLGDALSADIDMGMAELRAGNEPSYSMSKLISPKEDNRQAFDIDTIKEKRDLAKEDLKSSIDFRNKKLAADIEKTARDYSLALSSLARVRNEDNRRSGRVLRSQLINLLGQRGVDVQGRQEFLNALNIGIAKDVGASTLTQGKATEFGPSSSMAGMVEALLTEQRKKKGE